MILRRSMAITVNNDSEYKRYEELLLKRDQLKKEAGAALTLYVHEFNDLIVDVFRKKIDCIRLKKTIAYCQASVNRGIPVNHGELDAFIQKEMKAYNENLLKMMEMNESCRKLNVFSPATVREVKLTYHRIAKLIHPDINPDTAGNEVLSGLWNRTTEAYEHNDLKEICELEVLVNRALENAGKAIISIKIPDIGEKTAALEREIDEIVSTDPYMYKFILEDPEAIREKREALERELKEYTDYENELKDVLDGILKNGVIVWQMN